VAEAASSVTATQHTAPLRETQALPLPVPLQGPANGTRLSHMGHQQAGMIVYRATGVTPRVGRQRLE
jgi:hypothetical protein